MRRLFSSTPQRVPWSSPNPIAHALAAERQLLLLSPPLGTFPHDHEQKSVGTCADLSRALCALSSAGAHMESGVLLRAAAVAGVPLGGDARVAAVASAAWCGFKGFKMGFKF